MLRRLNQLFSLKAFLADKRGVSAIEFAMVAPLLIMAYLSLAELTLGMMASRRTSHLAATIGDLAAQSETLSSANITDLWAIGTSMLQPFSTGTNLKMRLTCVTMNSSNQAKVIWSVDNGNGLAEYTNGATLATVTTAQISANESLIVTEVEYDYDSPIGNFLPGETKFKDTFFHHPRNGAAVTGPS
ncbi:tadE family protein [Asticcacaulis biprosthecium C19]|uniref:TadE family protein n=1 Tax=Asticcacaulis biprosthecium C19 TaxID=715226 RepID=F4QJ47_9CAUL|nr:TadE/TadG family type IV pilus assembly protein [Asticcacaulis biprosthecium]EGF91878.1 tadE family protein [Asticcacaulis biprosthecium C19]